MVVRLGGFHTLMSFLGSNRSLMAGSGLEKLLETIYGTNTVIHMMSGKAISRALRGHFIVDAALRIKLIKSICEDVSSNPEIELTLNMENQSEEERIVGEKVEDNVTNEEMNIIAEMYDDLISGKQSSEIFDNVAVLKSVREKIEKQKKMLSEKSRTAKLWFLYMEYIDVVKTYIRAERTDNWIGHLAATERMLNLFAATGHVNYAKSARLYLQMMSNLQHDHLWLYKQFAENGYHCVRRIESYWAGLWSDLAIEQVMMRSIKSRGGLTRGREMTESVRTLWV